MAASQNLLSPLTRRVFLLAGVAALGGVPLLACRAASGDGGGFASEPVWQEDFAAQSNSAVDPRIWRFDLDPQTPTYNREEQAYTADPGNVRVEPGNGLVIEAKLNGYRYPDDPSGTYYEYTSGRIDTRDSFAFEYGKVEATMKLPAGSGTWPAFWLLSANEPNTTRYESSPSFDPAVYRSKRFYMKDGELDIMEHYGNIPGQIESTAHSFLHSREVHVDVPDYSTNFHTYGVELRPTDIRWTLDGTEYGRVEKQSDDPDEWPFGNGNKMYVILNLAMGGGMKSNYIDRSHRRAWRLIVRDVRFYEYEGAA